MITAHHVRGKRAILSASILRRSPTKRYPNAEVTSVKIEAVIHRVAETEGGGYWAVVPALPGCMTQWERYGELMQNIHEAIQG